MPTVVEQLYGAESTGIRFLTKKKNNLAKQHHILNTSDDFTNFLQLQICEIFKKLSFFTYF